MKKICLLSLLLLSLSAWSGETFDVREEMVNYTADFRSLSRLWVESLHNQVYQRCGASARGHKVANLKLEVVASQAMMEGSAYSQVTHLILHYPKVLLTARVTCR